MIDLAPNLTFFPMWLIFVTVLLALSRWVFTPTLILIEERKNQTEKLKGEVIQLSEKTRQLAISYEEQRSKIQVLASKEREKLINEARKEEAEMVGQARRENEMRLAEMKNDLNREKKEAELQLRQYTQKLASMMVDKILN